MSVACGTSVYTRQDESPFAPADEASTYPTAANAFDETWDQLINQLIDIRFLQDDWDGDGSAAPDPNAVAGATKLALTFKATKYPPADRVTASVNGTVYFEWHTTDGYQEIEVTSPIDAELRWVANGSKMAEVIRLEIR